MGIVMPGKVKCPNCSGTGRGGDDGWGKETRRSCHSCGGSGAVAPELAKAIQEEIERCLRDMDLKAKARAATSACRDDEMIEWHKVPLIIEPQPPRPVRPLGCLYCICGGQLASMDYEDHEWWQDLVNKFSAKHQGEGHAPTDFEGCLKGVDALLARVTGGNCVRLAPGEIRFVDQERRT